MAMELILLEHVDNLGQMGAIVKVRPGYARNYLLPQNKALRATDDNIAYFETQKAVLEKENARRKKEAEKRAEKLSGVNVIMIRHASEGGQLYGSVSAKDIAEAISEQSGEKIERNMVQLNQGYKMIGLFPVTIVTHPEVRRDVTINIARSEEEAKIQARKGTALVTEEEGTTEEPVAIAEEKSAEAKEDMLEASALKAEKEKAEEDTKKAAEKEIKDKEKIEKKAAKKAEIEAETESEAETEAKTEAKTEVLENDESAEKTPSHTS